MIGPDEANEAYRAAHAIAGFQIERCRRARQATRTARIRDRYALGATHKHWQANHNAPATATKGPIEKIPVSLPGSKPSKHSHSPAELAVPLIWF